jgi:hypothetical protein
MGGLSAVTTPFADATGDIVWAGPRQQGYMRFRGLPVNTPTKEQYQLWIFDKNQSDKTPIDGGVFDIPTTGEVIAHQCQAAGARTVPVRHYDRKTWWSGRILPRTAAPAGQGGVRQTAFNPQPHFPPIPFVLRGVHNTRSCHLPHSRWRKLMTRKFFMAAVLVCGLASVALAKPEGLDKSGAIQWKSATALAFGPEGVLFVADPADATLYALEAPAAPKQAVSEFKIENVDAKVAEALGAKAADITINDLAVQPDTGVAYLTVTKKGGDSTLIKITPKGEISKIDTSKINYAKMPIANAPDESAKDRRGNSLRSQSITDIAFVDARVYMTGMSKGEPTSTMRVVEFPFTSEDTSTEIEIYHGAHGKLENGAPIRTFVPLMFGGEPHLLAAYTCTPLVKLPISEIKAKKGEKLRGTTIAELGNQNQPIDIIAYQQGDKHYLLLANSARGVMKITTENIEKQEGITSRIAGTAGLKYETVANLTGIVQLAKLSDNHALVLKKTDGGYNLEAVALP